MNLRCVTDTARKNHCAHKVLNKRFLFVDSDFCQLACCLEPCSARNSIAMLASKESARIGYNPKPLIGSNWYESSMCHRYGPQESLCTQGAQQAVPVR